MKMIDSDRIKKKTLDKLTKKPLPLNPFASKSLVYLFFSSFCFHFIFISFHFASFCYFTLLLCFIYFSFLQQKYNYFFYFNNSHKKKQKTTRNIWTHFKPIGEGEFFPLNHIKKSIVWNLTLLIA